MLIVAHCVPSLQLGLVVRGNTFWTNVKCQPQRKVLTTMHRSSFCYDFLFTFQGNLLTQHKINSQLNFSQTLNFDKLGHKYLGGNNLKFKKLIFMCYFPISDFVSDETSLKTITIP